MGICFFDMWLTILRGESGRFLDGDLDLWSLTFDLQTQCSMETMSLALRRGVWPLASDGAVGNFQAGVLHTLNAVHAHKEPNTRIGKAPAV